MVKRPGRRGTTSSSLTEPHITRFLLSASPSLQAEGAKMAPARASSALTPQAAPLQCSADPPDSQGMPHKQLSSPLPSQPPTERSAALHRQVPVPLPPRSQNGGPSSVPTLQPSPPTEEQLTSELLQPPSHNAIPPPAGSGAGSLSHHLMPSIIQAGSLSYQSMTSQNKLYPAESSVAPLGMDPYIARPSPGGIPLTSGVTSVSQDDVVPRSGSVVPGASDQREGLHPDLSGTLTTLHSPISSDLSDSSGRDAASPSHRRKRPKLSDIWNLLSNMPTKLDLEVMVRRVEEKQEKIMSEFKTELQTLSTQVSTQQQQAASLDQRLTAVENFQSTQRDLNRFILLQVDDQENRGRRNNVKLRGIPESLPPSELHSAVTSIFNTVLSRPLDSEIIIDRVHRVLGPRRKDATEPRDVLCRVHFFREKEDILQEAWRGGPVPFMDTQVHLLPDVSRRTLAMRRILKPTLQVILDSGATYKWGHPFHVQIRRNGATFALHSPEQETLLAKFLDIPELSLPDWLVYPLPPVPPGGHPPISALSRRRPRGDGAWRRST